MTDEIVQISFAGCGGMYHYYLGIAKVLQDNFEMDNVIFCGCSGGCFPGLLLLLGYDIDMIHYELNRKILDEAASYRLGSLFTWNDVMRRNVIEFLDDDAYKQINGRLYVSTTNLHTFSNEIISEWSSTEDLIHCIQSSSFIPIIFEPKIWHYHRDTRFIDGAVTNNKVEVHPDKTCIHITCDKWRPANFNWFWCYTDYLWAEQLYMWGKEDATKNLDEFDSLKARNIPFGHFASSSSPKDDRENIGDVESNP